MWIFTNKGFVSVVAHRDEPGRFLVRGRRREHVEAFLDGVDGTFKIEETPRADYRWRAYISAEEFEAGLRAAARAVDYPNFKNSISAREDDYHTACGQVWSVMYGLQQ